MIDFAYNQTIEYEDCTRDLNFEAAQKWAQEHETSFEEDVAARKTLGDKLMRYFVIGSEPAPVVVEPAPVPEPTEEERNALRIAELQNYLNATDWYAVRFAETGVEIPDEIKTERQSAREEISRLREGFAG